MSEFFPNIPEIKFEGKDSNALYSRMQSSSELKVMYSGADAKVMKPFSILT